MITALLASFLESQAKQARGALCRSGTGKFMDEETLREICWQLGNGAAAKSILQQFGVAATKSATVDFRLPLVPWPFLAHLDPDALRHNAEVGLQHLSVEKSRSFFISIDETCFHATWSLVTGLVPDKKEVVIGGYHNDDKSFACLPDASSLPRSSLAKMSLHFILSRSDTFQQTLDMNLIPMEPQAPDKPRRQLEVLGQLMSALTKANDGRPPLGASYDGGGCNLLTAQTFLAMRPASELEEVPFFSECRVLRDASIRFFPFGILTFAGHPLHGAQDPLHVLKSFGLHHATGSRSISWGSTTADLTAMLECHMPVRAFLFADEQSDREACQRLNPRYLSGRWNQAGNYLMCFMGSLLSIVTLGGDQLTPQSRLYHALLGYYLLLLNLHSCKLLHGKGWQNHYLPLATVRLAVQMLAHVVLLARHGAPGASSRPSRFAERAAELHFAAIKKNYRGSPNLRDLLFGSHWHHLQQAKRSQEHGRIEIVPDIEPVAADRARQLSTEAFQDACLFQAWTSVNRTPSQVGKEFEKFWEHEGKALVGSTGDADEPGHAVDPEALMADPSVIEDEGEASDEAENMQILQGVEDHVLVKGEVVRLLQDMSEAEGKAESEKVAEPEGKKETVVQMPDMDVAHGDTQKPQCLDSDCTSFRKIIKAWSDLEEFDMVHEQSISYSRCLQRLVAMQPLIRRFVTHCRLQEGILSKTQIQGSETQRINSWQLLEHQLALARQAGAGDGGSRQSRWHSWMSVQSRIVTFAATEASGDSLSEIKHFRPGCDSANPQVVLYRCSDDESLQLALVQSVFRGARLKDAGNPDGEKITRKMRVTKPAASPLPATSTARVRLSHLTWFEDGRFFACALSPVVLCDPCGTVLAEVPVNQVSVGSSKLLLWFSPEVLQKLDEIRKKPELLEGASPQEPAGPVAEEKPLNMFTCSSFSRTIQGTKNIQAFLRDLPKIWSDAGMSFLDSDSRIQAPRSGKQMLWEEVVQRAPETFDVALAGQNNRLFGSGVLTRFRGMLLKAFETLWGKSTARASLRPSAHIKKGKSCVARGRSCSSMSG